MYFVAGEHIVSSFVLHFVLHSYENVCLERFYCTAHDIKETLILCGFQGNTVFSMVWQNTAYTGSSPASGIRPFPESVEGIVFSRLSGIFL